MTNRLTIKQACDMSPRFENVGDLMDEGVTINKYADPIDGAQADIGFALAEDVEAADAGLLWVSRDDIALAEFAAQAGSCA